MLCVTFLQIWPKIYKIRSQTSPKYLTLQPMSVKCKLLLYADDSTLIVSGSDPLSIELNSCRQWLIDNKLSLHLGKTESILFGWKN